MLVQSLNTTKKDSKAKYLRHLEKGQIGVSQAKILGAKYPSYGAWFSPPPRPFLVALLLEHY
jgi:hypothetical protein